MFRFLTFFALLWPLLLPLGAFATDVGSVTGLALPRYVSLRSDTVYVRASPGMRYPVKWVYQRRSYPLQIVQEFDTWRKVHDVDGDEGWIHQSLLSGKRYVLLKGLDTQIMLKKPDPASRPVAQLEGGVIAKLDECEDTWCKVSASGYDGWLLKAGLWGIAEERESE